MSIDTFTHFIKSLPTAPESKWNHDSLVGLAKCDAEEALFRDRKTLLKADQLSLWTRWFLEGIASPLSFLDPTKTKFHIFSVVYKSIDSIYPCSDGISKRELADVITEHLHAEVSRLRAHQGRDRASAEKKRELIESSIPPRCYLCGYAFSKEALDQFLKVKGRDPIKLPDLVDIFRPRGIVDRDLTIEIEHVVPVAASGFGDENLRLACGWCNKHKGAKLSIYDARPSPSKATYKIAGKTLNELPEPFWGIRLLAIHPRCQHESGCSETTETSELFIALRDLEGSPNPTNIRFYCKAHDPFSTQRFISRTDAAKIWNTRKRT